MKTKFYILSFIFSFIYTTSLSAQDSAKLLPDTLQDQFYHLTIRSVPTLTLQFSGFYDYGVFELSANNNGDFSSDEFIKGENFGVRHGIGGELTAKIPLQKTGHFRLNVSAALNIFSSKFSKINVSSNGIPEYVKYNVFSTGIGVENNFTPSFTFKTLIGIKLLGSIISGNANLINDSSAIVSSYNIVPAFRLGLCVYSGLEYMLNEKIGLNFGFQFTHANLWLKSTNTSNTGNDIYLDDKKVTPRVPFSGFKQFAFGSFYGGVSYFFGVEKKEYYYKKF